MKEGESDLSPHHSLAVQLSRVVGMMLLQYNLCVYFIVDVHNVEWHNSLKIFIASTIFLLNSKRMARTQTVLHNYGHSCVCKGNEKWRARYFGFWEVPVRGAQKP